MFRSVLLSAVAVAFSIFALPIHAEHRADHVIIVSFDGGKPAVIHDSDMPTIKKLAAEGAVTWTASTIFPSKTLPSHTSMLTGVGPEKHHVDWNNYEPIRGKVRVPTIFDIAREHEKTLVTA